MFGEWTFPIADKSEPKSVNEALSCPESKFWKQAMQEEINSINLNNVWTLTDLPSNRKAIGSKWVFKQKKNSDSKNTTYKARLVAQGYSQIEGEDYSETFSPVIQFDSVRALLALAANNDWCIHQMDVKTAFLNGKLSEEVYIKQPEGFVIPGKENKFCRLNKALYGVWS